MATTQDLIGFDGDADELWRWRDVPHAFPFDGHDDARSWAKATARDLAKRGGRGDRLYRARLEEITASRTDWRTVLYAVDATTMPRVVHFRTFAPSAFADMRAALQLEASEVKEPEFGIAPSAQLGTGTELRSWDRLPSGTIASMISFGWQTPDFWLVGFYVDSDLRVMEHLLPHVRKLAQAVRVEPAGGRGATTSGSAG